LCGCRYRGRPIASMLFLGPTGVGKTETARIFTEHLFGEESKLVRLDMSEYMTLYSIDILRGSHQSERGLFGHYYDRSSGSGTLLFDEIEKAHPLIMDLFLQILSAARLTLATGETLDLSNYIVIATSNIGSRMLMESRSSDRETLVRRTLAAGTNEMRPEIFARFDLHCVFNKLDYLTLKRIAELHVRQALGQRVRVLQVVVPDLDVVAGKLREASQAAQRVVIVVEDRHLHPSRSRQSPRTRAMRLQPLPCRLATSAACR